MKIRKTLLSLALAGALILGMRTGMAPTALAATLTNPSQGKVNFDGGDQISVLSPKNGNVKFTTSAGGSYAIFSGTAVDCPATHC